MSGSTQDGARLRTIEQWPTFEHSAASASLQAPRLFPHLFLRRANVLRFREQCATSTLHSPPYAPAFFAVALLCSSSPAGTTTTIRTAPLRAVTALRTLRMRAVEEAAVVIRAMRKNLVRKVRIARSRKTVRARSAARSPSQILLVAKPVLENLALCATPTQSAPTRP